MAVYTVLRPEAFARVSEAFGLGAVQQVVAIPEGSINTNHRVLTDQGRFFVGYYHQTAALYTKANGQDPDGTGTEGTEQ